MKCYMLILLLLVFQNCNNIKNTGKTNQDFCKVIVSEDKKDVKKLVDSYLGTLNTKEDSKINFKEIKNWLESNSCIQRVDLRDEIIETYPPIVEFDIVTKITKNHQLRLSISFDAEYRFINLKRIN